MTITKNGKEGTQNEKAIVVVDEELEVVLVVVVVVVVAELAVVVVEVVYVINDDVEEEAFVAIGDAADGKWLERIVTGSPGSNVFFDFLDGRSSDPVGEATGGFAGNGSRDEKV